MIATDPTRPAMKAKRLVLPGCFREATAEARGWISDCWKELPDGRKTELLGVVDIWLIVERQYDGGIEQFIKDGNY